MTFVRTVAGDIDSSALGVTYAHEHLIIDSPAVAARSPEIHLPSIEEAIAEVAECKAAGAESMIDAMPIGAGRSPDKLRAVAEATGVHIVMATGLHLPMYYDASPRLASADVALVEWFVADIEEGVDRNDHRGDAIERSDVRAGVIKIATQSGDLDDRDRKVVAAAAEAHKRTGAPILTHCEGGRGGQEQVAEFGRQGVHADHIVLSHTDKVPDVGYHAELLASGVFVEYDQALRQPPDAAGGTAWLIAELCAAGFVRQIMLGTDGARRAMWSTLGGSPGLAWLLTGLVSRLRALGVSDEAIDTMLVTNPARAFSFEDVS